MVVRPQWAPVHEELARWRESGLSARLWLRDDDAVTVTPALTRLADLCARHSVPYLIAAIPSQADRALAQFLAEQSLAEIGVHGWSHRNHAGPNSKKAEFPEERGQQAILNALSSAKARIDDLFGSKAVPIYVPPWNRISPPVAALLPDVGFQALSGFGFDWILASPRLKEINTHLDIIDWRRTRRGRNPATLITELAEHLAWSRANGQPAIGILTHHLAHDEGAWNFLDELFAEMDHAAVHWSRASELIS